MHQQALKIYKLYFKLDTYLYDDDDDDSANKYLNSGSFKYEQRDELTCEIKETRISSLICLFVQVF